MEKRDARRRLGDVIARAAAGESMFIERSVQPVAAVVSIERYEKGLERREARED